MEQNIEVKVSAIMTAPRFETNFARNIIEKALREVQLPLTCSGGVFYGQCMQTMLEKLIESNACDYAITIDFDSMFTGADVRRLLRWIVTRDEIHAITGLQLRRGKPVVLGTVPNGVSVSEDEQEVPWDGNPIKATTAHFGLTVIDLKELATVPKPWFRSEPDENGSWGPNKIDDDVYFWLKWKEAGKSIYLDPGVRIGHLEEMVTTYDENLKPVHMYPKDWEAAAWSLNS